MVTYKYYLYVFELKICYYRLFKNTICGVTIYSHITIVR